MIKKIPVEHIKDLLFELTKKELKVRYKNSYLGYLWSLLNPLALSLVFYLAFKVIMKVAIENYTLFIIAGLFPWQLFSNSVNASATCFIGNASLIKKTTFPKEMLVYGLISSELIHFLLSIPVIVFFLIIYGKYPTPAWLLGLPLIITAQFLMAAGFSLAVASANLFFRDLERLVGIFTTLLFYLTPIIYSMDIIPKEYHRLIMMNPLSPLILTYKGIFLEGVFDFRYFIYTFVWGVIVFFTGRAVYGKLNGQLAEAL
ncbi:MAG: ABC transporter permease [Deltaproteobacteria bacterium]|nr:ABC transporter permease [Deltaproteobacteria bacterium]